MTLVNVHLARWEGGWFEGGDLASEVDNGRSEARLDLGGSKLSSQVDWVIQQVVAGSSGPRITTVADIEPTALEQAYTAWGLWDRVNVLQPDGSFALEKVVGISCNSDDQGFPMWTVEFTNPLVERDQQIDTWLRRRLPGSLAGGTESVNPATPAGIIESGEVTAKRWTVSKDATATVMKSHEDRLNTPGHLLLWEATLSPGDDGAFVAYATDVSVRLLVSSTIVATVTVPAGDQSAHVAFAPYYVGPTDTVWAYITAGPTDTAVVCTARWI